MMTAPGRHLPSARSPFPFLDRHDDAAIEFPLTPTVSGAIDPFLSVNAPDDPARTQSVAGQAS